jgi:signal recognition particle subunit SRP54
MIQRAGPVKELLAKLPGIGDLLPDGANVDPRELRRIEAMILSMTPDERQRPELLQLRSRQERVARGSGTRVADLAELLKRFGAMRALMANIGQMGPGLLSRIPGIGRMFGAGPPGMPGQLPPEMLQELGSLPGNRRMARAQKAAERRQKRKDQRKQQRRGSKGKKKRR